MRSTLRSVPMCQGFSNFSVFFHNFVLAKLATSSIRIRTVANNPSNAEASFVLSTKTQIFLKTIETLSCWYSLDNSH